MTEIDLGDEDFRREFLKGLDEMAEEESPWQIHLPYEAAFFYRQDESVRHKFSGHVDSCPYCQELIDTLGPSSKQEAG